MRDLAGKSFKGSNQDSTQLHNFYTHTSNCADILRYEKAQNLKHFLQIGVQKYYDFLSSHELGLEDIKVKNIAYRDNTLVFNLIGELLSTDYLVLKIDGNFINVSDFDETKYYDVTNTLEIKINLDIHIDELKRLQNEYEVKSLKRDVIAHDISCKYGNDVLRIFNKYKFRECEEFSEILRDLEILEKKLAIQKMSININLDKISLYIDLKFLVKNVADFLDNDITLSFPDISNAKTAPIIPESANSEQRVAIKGILDSNISYVWGVSGSGKTQVVLLNAIYSLIKDGKKVLVLAPTNSALEQIFASLVENFDRIRISREILLRLGMPSSEYLEKYFETCELKGDEANLYGMNIKDKLKNAKIIGITLDGFIRRFSILSGLDFKHIFLDECGFSPLIKLIPALSLEVPITLLGDHKQLRPVCLMNERDIKNGNDEVCIWNLNVLFIEELLKDYKKLHLKSNYQDLIFEKIKLFNLNKTHRYGDNLAKVLDRFIYKNSLRGLGSKSSIYFIDSGKYIPVDKKNESLNEAIVIKDIIKHFRDYAVITPFRDQVRLLCSQNIDRGRVFTIHTSQGREFDTVIFSPVKLNYYLNDSNNLNALYALNVAVSRLKRELVIVCDYNFWIDQRAQFINALLKIATPYRFY